MPTRGRKVDYVALNSGQDMDRSLSREAPLSTSRVENNQAEIEVYAAVHNGVTEAEQYHAAASVSGSDSALDDSMVGAGADSVYLAAGLLLWRGGLSAGRLTPRIVATWVRIPATAPATFGIRSACVDCELIVLHYSCLEFLSGRP